MCAITTESDTDTAPGPRASRGRGRRLAPAATLAAAVLAGGCGGGASVGVGYGFGPDDDPPVVALSVAPAQAFAGQPVTLLADARDDYQVAYVAFYLLQGDGSAVRLDPLVGGPPYSLTIALPDSATGNVQFFARAVDDVSQFGDSGVAVVQLLR